MNALVKIANQYEYEAHHPLTRSVRPRSREEMERLRKSKLIGRLGGAALGAVGGGMLGHFAVPGDEEHVELAQKMPGKTRASLLGGAPRTLATAAKGAFGGWVGGGLAGDYLGKRKALKRRDGQEIPKDEHEAEIGKYYSEDEPVVNRNF